MRSPDCPDHGPLMLKLALGRLDNDDASQAEQLRLACPICSSWWRTHMEGDTARTVDAAVADVFSGFRPHRRRWLWPAAAAVAAAALAGSLLLHGARQPQQPAQQPAELAQRLFEAGDPAAADLTGDGVLDASDLAAALRSSATNR